MEYPNWFIVTAQVYFSRYLQSYANKPNLSYLQIGAYTGDASEFLLKNVLTHPTSTLTDVDTWEGSEEILHEPFDWTELEQFYDERMSEFPNVIKKKMTSEQYLVSSQERFDFVYVDGSHHSDDVYTDAILSWKLLKNGGILAFDDYDWFELGKKQYAPKIGIDRFLKEKNGKYLKTQDYGQVWIIKKCD